MGFNTALMICNDGLHQLEEDPDAGRKIAAGVLRAYNDEPLSIAIGNHCNPVTILSSVHADATQIVAVGGNWIQPVTILGHTRFLCSADQIEERVFQAMAEKLGYNVSRKAWRKREDAQAMEARRAETGTGSVHDSAVPQGCAQ